MAIPLELKGYPLAKYDEPGFSLTVSKIELLDRGLWDLACALKGIGNWESGPSLTFDLDQAVCLGLAEYPKPIWGPPTISWLGLTNWTNQ